MLQFLVANVSGAARREVVGGRPCLVAPMTILVPGVLPGSQGPLYYPADEVAKNPGAWNGIPIVLGHPTDRNGAPISARSPGVVAKTGMGVIRNDRFERGARRCEGVFDIQNTLRVSPATYAALTAGRPTEVSTGLLLNQTRVANGSHNGRPYTAVARDYRPDHLAVLVGTRGACSLDDGCGLLPVINQEGGALLDNSLIRGISLLGTLVGVRPGEASPLTNAGGGLPSDTLDMDPEKACQILKDGTVNGQPLTEAQRGMFGALCGQRKVGNEAPTLGANELSDEQRRQKINEALRALHTQDEPSCWVQEVYDDYVIYEQAGSLYRVDYTKTDTEVILDGDPVEVERQVTYVPTGNESSSSGDNRMKLTPQQRQERIATLTANCSCKENVPWKGKDAAALNGLSDDVLETYSLWASSLAANHGHAGQPAAAAAQPAQNHDQTPSPVVTTPDGKKFVVVNGTAFPVVEGNAPAGGQTPGQTTGNVQTVNGLPVAPVAQKPKSITEALDLYGSPQDKEVWNSALNLHNQAKTGLIERILNHFNYEGEARTQAAAVYNAMPMPQLQQLASGIPEKPANNSGGGTGNLVPDFFGSIGAPPSAPVTNETPLTGPTYEFSAPRSAVKKEKVGAA